MKAHSLLACSATAAAVALGAPAAAEAKLCVRIAAPATAVSGATFRVSATTLLPTAWVAGRPVGLRPFAASVRLRLTVVGPRGEYREVPLRRLAARPSVARTTLRLAGAGTWRLSLLGWDFAPRACAPPALVRVVNAER